MVKLWLWGLGPAKAQGEAWIPDTLGGWLVQSWLRASLSVRGRAGVGSPTQSQPFSKKSASELPATLMAVRRGRDAAKAADRERAERPLPCEGDGC